MYLETKFARLVLAAAVGTLLLGLAGLAGWWLRLDGLRHFAPDAVRMNPNSALALVLLGVAHGLRRWGDRRGPRLVGAVLGGGVLLGAGAELVRMTQASTVGGWLAAPFRTASTAVATQPTTPLDGTLPYVFAGLALLLLAGKPRRLFGLVEWIGLTIVSMGFLNLASLVVGRGPEMSPVSVNTSLGIILVGCATLGARLSLRQTALFRQTAGLGAMTLLLLGLGLVLPLLLYGMQAHLLVLAPGSGGAHETLLLTAVLHSVAVFGLLTAVLRRVDGLDARRKAAETTRDELLARLQHQTANLEVEVSHRTSELRETTERLDLALRSGGFGVWEWEPASGRLLWDARQCRLYGFAPGDAPTTAVWQARWHPEERAQIQAQFEQALAAGGDFDLTLRLLLPGGEERIIASHLHIIGAQGGRPARAVGIDQDVTEEHRQAQALRSLSDRLQLAVRAAGYGVWELDLRTHRMHWDERMFQIYGVAREAFSGSNEEWRRLVEPADAERDDARIRAVLAGDEAIYDSVFRIRRPDGELRQLEALGVVQRAPDGTPLRLVGLDRDITEAAVLRDQLRVAEERWHLALSSNNDGVWDWDLAKGEVFRSARFGEILGRPAADLAKDRMVWEDCGHPDEIPAVRTALEDTVTGRTPLYECEFRLRHAAGHWIWVLGRGKVVARDPAGNALRVVGTLTDITARKQMEEKLRHGEEMSLQLGRLAQIGAWEWDLDASRLTWAPELFRIHEVELGFEPAWDRVLAFYPDETARTLRTALRKAAEGGVSFDLEVPITTARGHKVWARVLGHAQARHGHTLRVYGAFQDITARRDAEEMRRQFEGQLFQAQKMETLGTLAGGIAHDFNNLLTGILGYQDLALDTLLEMDPARGYLNASREASLRARELVEQILTFSRQGDSEKVPVNLVQVVEDARRFLRATVPATIRIAVEVAEGCRRVSADATQIHQVLLNLGSNGAHAMQATGGTLRFSLAPVELDVEQAAALSPLLPGHYVRLRCGDTGHGMDAETMQRIFDPFFTTKEVGQGTGLGLSVALGIMQAHKGAITVESTLGQGSCFTLYLPVAEEGAAEAETPETSVPRGRGELVAVVDDEDIVRSFAQMALEKTGYRVAAFDSPAACLEVLRRNAADYALLLTDQTMPVMKGVELAAAVRAFAPHLPVVIMSGYFSRISADTLEQIGNVSLMSKPFTHDELARGLFRAMHPQAGSRAPFAPPETKEASGGRTNGDTPMA